MGFDCGCAGGVLRSMTGSSGAVVPRKPSSSCRASRSSSGRTSQSSGRTLCNIRRAVTSDATKRLEENYDIRDLVGEGAFGQVAWAVDKNSGRRCVLKTIDRKEVGNLDALDREVALQSELDHPHIVRVYETILDDSHLHIVLELCQGGDLAQAIEEQGARTERQARCLSLQILQAVRYMHNQGVVHRDLKLENFLLQHEGVLESNIVKLIDFGFARRHERGQRDMRTICGSPGFMAPEVISGVAYDERCDIFSCGVIIFSMLTDRLPFDADHWREILKNTTSQPLRFTDEEEEELSEGVRALIMLMCRKTPSERPIASEVLCSPWLHEGEATPAASPYDPEDIESQMRSYASLDAFSRASLWRVAYNLPDSEVEKMRDAFKFMDLDGDGKITCEELCAETPGCSIDNMQALICEVDSNHNGWLDYTEFLATMLTGQDELPETAMLAAFRSLDLNNTGSLTEDEIDDALGANAHACFSIADKNGDGEISYEEFRDLLRSNAQRARSGETPARGLIQASASATPVTYHGDGGDMAEAVTDRFGVGQCPAPRSSSEKELSKPGCIGGA